MDMSGCWRWSAQDCMFRQDSSPGLHISTSLAECLGSALTVQFVLNNGVPVASSVPATEHSVMTSWATEKEAIDNMLDHFGSGLFSCVMDSYDYAQVGTFVKATRICAANDIQYLRMVREYCRIYCPCLRTQGQDCLEAGQQ